MQLTPKFLADLITASRSVVAVGLLGAAWQANPETLPWVVGIVVIAWSGDMVDGWLAKKGGYSPIAWVGQRDHEIDASLAGATLVYLWRIGLVSNWLLVLLSAVTFLVWYRLRSDWVWMSFNTGSHLVALTALVSTFPALAVGAVGWAAMVTIAGRRRAVQMLGDVRCILNRALGRTVETRQ
jgi:phosphatidylglycerophosphate synthase